MRRRASGVLDATAVCVDCEWFVRTSSALGLAAQHHDRTGHTVECQQTIGVRYGEPRSDRKRSEAMDRAYGP
jgi:hypothetical protein